MVASAEIAGERPRSATSVATPGLREVVVVWLALGAFLALTFATYARLEPEELYNVSRGGLAGGASRVLVELNYPDALVVVPVLGLCAARLRRPAATGLAALGLALCAAVPFVVDPDDLDARAGNALPALGVAIGLALTAWALAAGGLGARSPRLAGDPLRLALAAATLLVSIPWLFAEAGFYAPDPVYADELPPGATIAAVHLGSHHGTEGALLLAVALALSRVVPAVRGRLAGWVSGALALMLAYGAALAAEDFWHEQVAKRGAVEWRLPDVILPSVGWGWLGILVGALVVELLWFRPERRLSRRAARP